MVAGRTDLDAMIDGRSGMHEFFRNSVVPALLPGRELQRVKRKHEAYRDGLRVLTFEVRLVDEPPRQPRLASITLGDPARIESLYSTTYGGAPLLPSADASAGALHLPAHGCLVEFFPAAWKLPALSAASDPDRVAAWLGEVAPPVSSVELTMLRYRPHRRCVLRYAAGDGREWIAKAYPSADAAGRMWDNLRALHEQLADAPVAVPGPVALHNKWNVVLMSPVAGTNVGDLLGQDITTAGPAIDASARALAQLHALSFASTRSRSLAQLLGLLHERADRLPEDVAVRDDITALLDVADALAARLPAPPLSLIHADYKPSQVYVDEERTSIIDFDRACMGDPAMDVGSFLAALRRKGLLAGREGHAALAQRFLDEYLSQRDAPGLAERARLFEGVALLRMVTGKLVSFHRRRGRVRALLREAESCLSAL